MLAITASSRAVKINTPKNKNDPTLEKGKHIILYLSICQTNVRKYQYTKPYFVGEDQNIIKTHGWVSAAKKVMLHTSVLFT